ncbi:MAG: ferrous iron transport protein B [Verrucomicrobia bacterium]|nr:MAG: ferrous iron transport protein B [Verrucomicrobiota bacterium]
MTMTLPSKCADCPVAAATMRRLGIEVEGFDFVVALAGNPNTGKSTIFNRLTGLRQHTGNWPGKTISRAEGGFSLGDRRYKLVDLPGTYSLLSASPDEEVARDFILFGRPDVTVIVVDATALERNLNLAQQVIQVTERVVVCLNLMDEARMHGISIDIEGLEEALGVPVVPTAARQGQGIPKLLETIEGVATGRIQCRPPDWALEVPGLEEARNSLVMELDKVYPGLAQKNWVALRLLLGDASIEEAVQDGRLKELSETITGGTETGSDSIDPSGARLIEEADRLRWSVPPRFHDQMVERIYQQSARIADAHTRTAGDSARLRWQQKVDRLLTNRWTGIPVMMLIFAAVLWITIIGANAPSGMLFTLLIGKLHPVLQGAAVWAHLPDWLGGILIDGMYLTTAWVVAVMLPPMAIFFPLFTILEDLGYLPRVAFNLDRIFQAVGAHGKQALTLSMGFGCNAAGVIAARVIDSPRERLIAIITNNFALCNGRWPTQILIATIFLGVMAPPALAGFVAAGSVFAIAMLGIGLTFGTSWLLSRTVLRGEASSFSLELPPYRPPRILNTLYTSLIDRTIFVLWRAIVFALPAGAIIWLSANIMIGDVSVAAWAVDSLDPIGLLIGLNGVILVAYIVAIPANEIVVPTILMLTVLATGMTGVGEQGAGVMFETGNGSLRLLLEAGGWTTLTAVCLMLFSLSHNPCSTTIYTIYKETRSAKWTALATFFPVFLGIALCGLVAWVWRMVG